MTLAEIANALKNDDAKIILAYAFNATGKTQLCVAYKDATKYADGSHAGVYYNAYSEDLFVWQNDEENNGANVRLTVQSSSLSQFHISLTEDNVRDKLKLYKPHYGFALKLHEDDPAKGIESISFFIPNQNPDVPQSPIKISRGEERIFIWCFFLALFEVEGWADKQSSHFFIDDPVSSLDDHNIFITASTLFALVENYHDKRKIIITTHHIGLFSILYDWLKKGEKSGTYKNVTKPVILTRNDDGLSFKGTDKDVFLYHLHLLQVLQEARGSELKAFHFALLRQVLENVASFLGVGRVSYVLEQLGFKPEERIAEIVNFLSHKNVYHYESDVLVPDNEKLFQDVFDRLMEKYKFLLHTPTVEALAKESVMVSQSDRTKPVIETEKSAATEATSKGRP